MLGQAWFPTQPEKPSWFNHDMGCTPKNTSPNSNLDKTNIKNLGKSWQITIFAFSNWLKRKKPVCWIILGWFPIYAKSSIMISPETGYIPLLNHSTSPKALICLRKLELKARLYFPRCAQEMARKKWPSSPGSMEDSLVQFLPSGTSGPGSWGFGLF